MTYCRETRDKKNAVRVRFKLISLSGRDSITINGCELNASHIGYM